MTKRVISGIKPTGDVHLGGYLGAMKHWPHLQQPGHEVFYFIADLHALNSRQPADVLSSQTLDLVAWLLAVGIDPDKSTIFIQSQVPAHAELCWILNNYTTMGELGRMTQYKDKARKTGAEGQLAALFAYPVLMAADILLYSADIVPVGDDQLQHIELTRTIAERFNNLYGATLQIPNFSKPSSGARVMMLDEPTQKMSKSEGGEGCIYLLDKAEIIHRKVKRAQTDSLGRIRYDRKTQPGISNLLEILAALEEKSVEEIGQAWESRSYGELKEAVAESVIQCLGRLQEKFNHFRADRELLDTVLAAGAERAKQVADSKLREVREKLGLL